MPATDPRPPADEFVVYDHDGAADPNADTVLLGHRYERTEHVALGGAWDMAAWIADDRRRRELDGEFDAGGRGEIVAPSYRVEAADLPRAPKPLALRAAAAGFEVRCQASIVYITPTLFAASREGEDGHTKGDLRYPDRDDTWWGVQAVLRRQGRLVAAFWAEWVTSEAVGAKTKTAFKDARTFDLVTGHDLCTKAGDFEAWFDVFAPPPAGK